MSKQFIKNNTEGIFNIGMLYFEGNGVIKNIEKAAKLFEREVTFPP